MFFPRPQSQRVPCDLFHQVVFQDEDFKIECDYTGIFPQYFVYDIHNDNLCGMTNASYFMGSCRIIMNEYKKMCLMCGG